MGKSKLLSILFFIVIILIIFLIIIIVLRAPSITSNIIKEPPSEIKVYFCPEDMCMEKMLPIIESSKDIKCAFYELNLPEMISALKRKNADVVIEDSTHEDKAFHTGYSSALMHNKFCIFDNEIITTGSMNPTINDNYLNNNNLVIIRSKALAQNYLAEFSELKSNIYGKGSRVRNPVLYIGDIKIENRFCPEDSCKLHVINALKAANKSIYFMTFSFTDVDIGNLLWNKHYQGLDVKGIFDRNQISKYSRYEDLKEFSIIDNNKYKLHDKVFIIDNETVITGSYNPSQNANMYNDENILIITDKAIAEEYISEFRKLFYLREAIPEKAQGLVITEILYDAEGSDEGKEYVELKNLGETLLLDYYSISDNKSTMRLNGTLGRGESVKIAPKFSLKNTDGLLYLRHNSEIIDFVAWNGQWKIKTNNNELLVRKNLSSIGETAWTIDKV